LIVLTSAVVASVAMMLFERQDSSVLQQRITQLKAKNASLEAQLRTAQQHTSADSQEIASRPTAADRTE
jgi:hypothetical protein